VSVLSLQDADSLPNLDARQIDLAGLQNTPSATSYAHPPRILLLYGSLRERSYSRLLTLEAARLLRYFGAEPRIFDPARRFAPAGRCG